MPYITEDNKKVLAPDLNVLMGHLLRMIGDNHRTGKYFFFFFLTALYESVKGRIETESAEDTHLRYKHLCHLDGTYSCAWKELWDRWGELVPLRPPRLLDRKAMGSLERMTKRMVKEADRNYIRLLTRNLVGVFQFDLGAMVGEINFSISEVGNLLGNAEKATHQDLLNMAANAPLYLYSTYARPYEDSAINKNGDTAGFKHFYELFGVHLRSQ